MGVGEGAWPLWVVVGQGVGAGAEAHYKRGRRWLQLRGALVGGWVLKHKRGLVSPRPPATLPWERGETGGRLLL